MELISFREQALKNTRDSTKEKEADFIKKTLDRRKAIVNRGNSCRSNSDFKITTDGHGQTRMN
jgi:hypothetical protein